MSNNSCENNSEFDSEFAQQFLRRHNELRKLVNFIQFFVDFIFGIPSMVPLHLN